MSDRLKAEDEIHNSGRNPEIDILWPDECGNYASVSLRDMYGSEDSFFEALKGEADDDFFVVLSFPSGRLTFDEKADIDIDIPSGEDEKKGYRYMGAGTGLHFAATGLKSFSGMMGNAWRNNDDDDDDASMKSTSNGFGMGPPSVDNIAFNLILRSMAVQAAASAGSSAAEGANDTIGRSSKWPFWDSGYWRTDFWSAFVPTLAPNPIAPTVTQAHQSRGVQVDRRVTQPVPQRVSE